MAMDSMTPNVPGLDYDLSVRGFARGLPGVARHRLLGTGGAMAGTYTVFGCYPLPAHVDGLQVRVLSTTNDAVNNVKASILMPARWNDGVNGLDAAGNPVAPVPVTWGATQVRNPRNPGGGAATAQVSGAFGAAPNQVEGGQWSDLMQVASVDRADQPGASPLVMLRTYGVNVPGMASAGLSGFSASTFRSVNPDHWSQFVQNADHTATVGGVPVATTAAATQWAPSVEFLYSIRGMRIVVIAFPGDSLMMGWPNTAAVNGTAGGMNGWGRQMVSQCRTIAPTGFVSWHRDGFTAARFHEQAMNAFIGDGCAGVTHIFIPPSSVNTWRTNPAAVAGDLRRTTLMIDQCARNGVRPILVYPWAGQDIGSAPEMQVRQYIDAAARAGIAAFDARRVVSRDGTITSNEIKPEFLTRDATGAIVDLTHLNDIGHAAVAREAFSRRREFNIP